MNPFFVGVWAIVPSLLLIWYFHSRDIHPEPQRVVWTTFGLGMVTALPISAVAGWLDGTIAAIGDPYGRAFTTAFVRAGLIEELFKYGVVVGYAARHEEFDEPMDGIVYGVVASLGFATVENFGYISHGDMGLAIGRAVLAAPGHAFLGAIMGYYVGQSKFGAAGQRKLTLAKALAYPVVLHGLYDAPMLTGEQLARSHLGVVMTEDQATLLLILWLVSIAVFLAVAVWAIRLTRRLRREQLASIAEAEGMAAPRSGGRSRTAAGWLLLASGGLFASLGGMVVLALIVAVVQGVTRPWSASAAVELVGLVPLVSGVVMFARGLALLRAAVGRPQPSPTPIRVLS